MSKSARFDYLEAPVCERCGARTRLSRRQPHPTFGPQFELVTYELREVRKLANPIGRTGSGHPRIIR